jgi:hypothetical protein
MEYGKLLVDGETALLAARRLKARLKSHRMLAQKQLVDWMNLGRRRECHPAELEKDQSYMPVIRL